MGIYLEESFERTYNKRNPREGRTTLVRTISEFGVEWTEVYELVVRFENRTDCFCCSCGDREESDPHCRDHGWTSKRPCELHELPGEEFAPEDIEEPKGSFEPYVPDSVQKYRGY